MEHESPQNLLMVAAYIVPIAAFVYASSKKVRYPVALFACAAWAATIIGLLLFNYWIADSLGFRGGYDPLDISPYAVIVQLLFLVEIPALLYLKRRMLAKS